MKLRKQYFQTTASVLLAALLMTACGVKPDTLLTSAKDYLAKKDNKAAVIQIKNALQINPDFPEARYLLGTVLLNTGDAVGAEVELRKALDLKHPQDRVVPQLAKALLAQGSNKKLIDEWSGTALTQPEATANLQLSLTYAYAQQGQSELSNNALNAALAADPAFEPALIAQARQKAAQRDFEGSLEKVNEIIARYPASYEAWKLKGDIFLYAKKLPDDALAAYQKSVQIKPEFMAGQAAVIMLLTQQGRLPEVEKQLEQLKKYAANEPQTKLFEAQLAYQKKDFKLAQDLLAPLLKASPNNVQALQLAGAVALQLNSLIQAEDYLSRALQGAPDLPLARRALVLTYLRLGQPAQSMATLQPGLLSDNIDPELLSLAGEVYLKNGNLKMAQEYFSKAAQKDPKDARKRTTLAVTHLMAGSTETAFSELQEIAGADTGISADLALISAHMNRQEFDQALIAIDSLEKKQPTNPLAAMLRGRILLGKKDGLAARKNFERALTLDASYFPAVAALAGLDMDDKRPDEAKKRFEAVLLKNPKNTQALLALAELAARSGAPDAEVAKLIGNAVAANPTEVSTHLILVDFYLRKKELKSASSAAQNAVSALPASPEALDALGRTQQASGEYNQAIASYNKLVAMQPFSTLPLLRLAEVHLAEKNSEAARTSLRKVLALKPDVIEAQRALIALDLQDKRPQEALKTAHTIQLQRPLEAVGYALEGDIHAAMKNWVNAATAYRAGLKQVNSIALAIKLHHVLVDSGNGAEADKFSMAWQKDNAKEPAFPLYLGDLALARQDYAAAEKSYTTVIKLQATNALAYNNLAWVSSKLNREGAVAYAEKANSLAPNQPAFMDTLAMLLSDKGQYAKAVELQTKALALQPQNASLKLNLIKIYIKGGQKELAKKELDALSQLGDKFSGQAEVLSLRKLL